MGNDISTSNNDSNNDLINEIQNIINADTETFRSVNQNGGIVWNPKDIFITHEGLIGEVIQKRTDPDLIYKNVYEVRINGRLETMWPESNMIESPESKAKREAAERKKKLEEEERKKRVAAELAAKRHMEEEKRKKIAAEHELARKIAEDKNKN